MTNWAYLCIASHHLIRARHIVFLSSAGEKCIAHMSSTLEAHLKPPYKSSHLNRIWTKLTHPDFTPQPTDLFFLKSHARFIPIH